jgi:AcrR family transcriptional regulator
MPKIDAPTVAEHHARRRATIVSAAADLLGAEGVAGVSPAAVAAAAGLARSSVYQYYSSTGALVGAAVEEMFRRALSDLDEAMAGAGTPPARLEAYLDASLDAALAGHLPLGPYRAGELVPDVQARVRELHDALNRPLVAALADAGVADSVGVAGLISGVVNAAAVQVQHGQPVPVVRRRVHVFVRGAVGLR